jgi:iron-sulfur cluster assembly accessory protein
LESRCLNPVSFGWHPVIMKADNRHPEQVTTGERNMVNLTETAVGKVREILETQDPKPAGLRISVVGGGCSGFSYSMAFENAPGMLDKTYNYDGLKVFVDQASMLYLDGAEVDYVESLEGSGFKFNNPHVKSTCGCGSSFSA